jgi:predicted deacylase
MARASVPGRTSGTRLDSRVVGRVHGERPGPSLICVVGIHGNEPAGVHAVRRILETLPQRAHGIRGDFVALAGNLAALAAGRRFVDRDLNRAWTEERLRAVRGNGQLEGAVEDREQIELLREIETVLQETRGRIYVLDLHTTSGPGGIFSAFTDALPQRAFASQFPVPMIFGLEEQVEGTLLDLLSRQGIVSITIETGQHQEEAAVDRAASAIWLALVAAGLLPERLVPEATEARKLLRRDTDHLPTALEMRYRRPKLDGDGFQMDPGYSNFQKVRAGQLIARDNDGPISVHERARLLMPLYQEQGEDAYFLVREFSPFWMHVSHVMRRAGVSRIAHWLPGVRRVDGSEDHLIVNKRVARFFARQLFHLLGFRQMSDAGTRLVMRRRRFDEGRSLQSMPSPSSLRPEEPSDHRA